MRNIKAVIFDMDGVLIDAKEWHYEALNSALRTFGLEINRLDHENIYDGLPTREKLTLLSKAVFLPNELHDFINALKQRYTIEMAFSRCRPQFHHEYALARLKKEGYLLAVASNSSRRTVDIMLEEAGLTSYIDFSLSNNDVVRPKPDPEIYRMAIQKLGLHPSQCLIVEDNPNGIAAAMASGAHVLSVTDTSETNYHNIVDFIAGLEARVS